MSLLAIKNLSLDIGKTPILRDVSLSIAKGKIFGLAGESGAGKSMTALSIMGLLPHAATARGSITLDGDDLLSRTERQMCAVRGRQVGMVFQEPMSALNPLHTIGAQVAETVRVHERVGRAEAFTRAAQILARVGLSPAHIPMDRFAHELSGGQRQRVVIAMAMVLRPKLIIADEPTTALDVTAQAQILDLLRRLVDEDGVSLMLITHDLAVMAQMADDLAILRRGEIIESGPTPALLRGLNHDYSKTLLKSTALRPLRTPHVIVKDTPILEARNIVCRYEKSDFRAVDDVSLTIRKGENVGLVGESGCGKSTLLRALLALRAPQEGEVLLRGEEFKPGANAQSKVQRKDIQMVFQDPYGSFNPRHKVSRLVAEPFHLDGKKRKDAERRAAVVEMLQRVGLAAADADKYPHQFSGGQRQRIAIARALITRPSLVALDEAVSALDVTARARVLALLADLSDDLGVSFLFVSHDLGVVRAICDRVLVMRGGKIVEDGPVEDVFSAPRHPYTRALIAATPDLETALAAREDCPA
ncbi:MAG: ABC transporter ATP-binding protein [Robiginitomaculum sp.]|nr:ABC transporter ATP-binding protein [Robiginitomaculum sp.]MDQ7076267.1 ABC transporter ATP-binding protein [Robiginitomaculum sp.]